VRIAASDVSLAVERPSLTTIMNVLPAIIADIQPVGEAQANVVVTIGHREGGARVLARVTRRSANLLGFTVGQPIFAQIKAVSLVAASQGRSTP
jgi:molybdate transport system ATP-binding protein